jgi:TPR repeat protein
MEGCEHAGALYDTGKGVDRNADMAGSFYRKACNGGDKPACDLLAKLH